jgi:hypothetical protein
METTVKKKTAKKSDEELSPKQKEQREQRRLEVLANKLTRKVLTDCRNKGMRIVQLELEYLKNNKAVQLPTELNRDVTIDCYVNGIEKYKEELSWK